MRKWIYLLILLLLFLAPRLVTSQPIPSISVTEEDGSPAVYDPYEIKFTNATVTDNADGTVSIDVSGTSSGDIEAVGDCASGSCFVAGGTASTTLLSTSGTLTLGGVDNTNNENMTLDFETFGNKIYLNSTTAANIRSNLQITMDDERSISFGSGGDARFNYQTLTGNHDFQIGLSVGSATQAGFMSLMELGDVGVANRSPLATSADPVLRVYSSDATNAGDYIEFSHNQTSGFIEVGAGTLTLIPNNSLINIKDNNGDVIEIMFEEDTGVNVLAIKGGGARNQTFIAPSDEGGNQVIITNQGNDDSDHDHAAAETNPTLFIHSDTDPDTDNTEYGSMAHSGTGTGDGSFDIASGTGVICFNGVDGSNNESICLDLETAATPRIYSPLTSGIAMNDHLGFLDTKLIQFGTSLESTMGWETTGNDNLRIATKVGDAAFSGYVIILEEADRGDVDRSPSGTSADPVLRVYSSDATDSGDYIEFYHDQTKANIVANDDIEIDSGSSISLDAGTGTFNLIHGETNAFKFRSSTANAEMKFVTLDGTGNQIIITNDAVDGSDHDHATTTNPTLFIHSDKDPDTDNNEYLMLYQDQTNAVIATGEGSLCLGGDGQTNNENICFDFETTAGAARVGTTTGLNYLDFVGPTPYIRMRDDTQIAWGSGLDFVIIYESNGNDNVQLGVEVGSATSSGYVSLLERGDQGDANRSPSGTSADPVLRVYSSDATVATDYIEFYHDQGQAFVRSGDGGAIVIASGTNELFLRATDSDAPIMTFEEDNGSDIFRFYPDGARNQSVLSPADNGGNQVIISNFSNGDQDHDHATTTDPTFFIHSDLAPDTSNNQWGSLYHDQEDFIIETGVNVGTGSGATTDNNAIIFKPRGLQALQVAASGVVVSGSLLTSSILADATTSGVLTLGGTGGSNNENLTIDFETNTFPSLGSTSGASLFSFGTLRPIVPIDINLEFGSSPDASITYESTGNDNWQFGTQVGSATGSGYMSLMEKADLGDADRSPLATSADPVLRVYSSDATAPLDYIEMYHDQTSARLYGGSGTFDIGSASTIRFDPGNGVFSFRDDTVSPGTFNAVLAMSGNDSFAQAIIRAVDAGGNQVIIANSSVSSKDFDHDATTNPTLFIHSDKDPDTANDEWISFEHDTTDGVINLGSGDLKIGNATSGIVPAFVTADPCGTMQEGSIFYNSTGNFMCYCSASSADLKFVDDAACF